MWILGPAAAPTISAVTRYPPSSAGSLTTVPSSTTSRAGSVMLDPTSPVSLSTVRTSSTDAFSCLPPQRTIAYTANSSPLRQPLSSARRCLRGPVSVAHRRPCRRAPAAGEGSRISVQPELIHAPKVQDTRFGPVLLPPGPAPASAVAVVGVRHGRRGGGGVPGCADRLGLCPAATAAARGRRRGRGGASVPGGVTAAGVAGLAGFPAAVRRAAGGASRVVGR